MPQRYCKIEECIKYPFVKGLCSTHVKLILPESWKVERERISKQQREWRKKVNYKQICIGFLGKNIYLDWNPKKGICEKCSKFKKTDLHHFKYLPCMVWTCTVELCRRCHQLTDGRIIRRDLNGRFITGGKLPELGTGA